MTASSVAALPDPGAALCIVFILLVPFAFAGMALINTGLGRARSAAHAMLTSLCVIAVAMLVYFVCGFAVQGYAGGPAHVVSVGGKPWNMVGAGRFFLLGIEFDGSPVSLALWLQMFGVALAAMIPLSSGADRWRLGAICASTAMMAAWTYPLFAHWVWGGGWLAQLGVNYGLGHGFLDAGGASVIQTLGGLHALAITWILGPRKGKYLPDGMPAAIPGHNSVLVMFGCLLALVGWVGLNSAGAILFNGVAPGRSVLIAINTTLAASSATLASVVTTRLHFGKPDASLCANGWFGGLVASCAACAFLAPAAAVAIGLVAGVLVAVSVQWLDQLSVDDPGGAISVHGLAGIWGVLAVCFMTQVPGRLPNAISGGPRWQGGDSGQWLAQLVGVATLLGFVLPLAYGLNSLLNRFSPLRVAAEGERQGMDLHELGAGAYPEFATYGDEFMQR